MRRLCRAGRRRPTLFTARAARVAARAIGMLGLVAGTGVAVAVPSGAHASERASATRAKLAVLGFQSDSDPLKLIDRSAAAMTLVGIDGVNLIGAGEVSAPTAVDLRQLARAHADRLPAVLLIGNWSPAINDFSEALAHGTLGDPSAVQRAAAAIAADVMRGHWNGVSVDLESLAPRDRAGLSELVGDLRSDLPPADSLTVCLEAFTSPGDYTANGYDLAALARAADQIVLMTYDDHGPWENTPGPIGPLGWQRASVRALETVVPRQRIFLGAANYGYAWRPHANVNLNVGAARALVSKWRARARWIPAVGEWTATLGDGSTLWWADARSVALRLRLARALGVHGVAVWALGTGDPLPR
jgi:spore germination protein